MAATETGAIPKAALPSADDCLHLDPETRKDAVLRLKGAHGHLAAVLRMLDNPNVYCVDVMKQLSAVQGAITKVNDKVLRSHIKDHVSTEVVPKSWTAS